MQKKLINIIHIKITVSFMIYHLIFLQSILNRNVSTFIHFGWLSNAVPFTWLSTLPNNSIFIIQSLPSWPSSLLLLMRCSSSGPSTRRRAPKPIPFYRNMVYRFLKFFTIHWRKFTLLLGRPSSRKPSRR